MGPLCFLLLTIDSTRHGLAFCVLNQESGRGQVFACGEEDGEAVSLDGEVEELFDGLNLESESLRKKMQELEKEL
ncbi:hypothetical protein ACFX11_014332 [Malus domestica]